MMSHTRTLIFSPTAVDRRWTREETNAHDVIFALTRLEASEANANASATFFARREKRVGRVRRSRVVDTHLCDEPS